MSTKTTIALQDFKCSDGTTGSVHIYHDYMFEHEGPIRLELDLDGLGISIQATIDRDDLDQLEKLVPDVYNAKKLLGIEK